MPPFVKWLGGKGTLRQQLTAAMPENFNRYIEPMVGGGALFFHLAETGRLAGKHVYLGDANEWLIHTYRMVRDEPESLIDMLRGLQAEYHRRPELLFYEVRKAWNAGNRNAARFIFLKATSFNGLWRVNNSGDLNMPWGHYEAPNICNASRLRACSVSLQGVALEAGHFAGIPDPVPGDLVYLDPPYFGTFDKYVKEPFASVAEHTKLIKLCSDWTEAGVHVLYTHADTPQARKWLREYWPGCKWTKAEVRRMVNCKGAGRTVTYDLIVKHPHVLQVEKAG